jgi:hypothetical protein
MLRQERFGGGMADQKDLDAEFARSIMSDGKFQVRFLTSSPPKFLTVTQNNLDYIDENADKLGRQKMRSDAMKRQFAVHGTWSSSKHALRLNSTLDYKRTQKAMAECHFCFGEDDSPPKCPVVAMGTRVYLSCTVDEELLDGHCLIVPMQHHLNMLEADDEVWDEVRVRWLILIIHLDRTYSPPTCRTS